MVDDAGHAYSWTPRGTAEATLHRFDFDTRRTIELDPTARNPFLALDAEAVPWCFHAFGNLARAG